MVLLGALATSPYGAIRLPRVNIGVDNVPQLAVGFNHSDSNDLEEVRLVIGCVLRARRGRTIFTSTFRQYVHVSKKVSK